MASTPQKERGYFVSCPAAPILHRRPRQRGKACPPSRLRQPTHDKENAIRYPLANGKVRLQA